MGELSLLGLPNEVLEMIFKNPVISIKDLFNLRAVCSSFNTLISDTPMLWKQKIFSRWSFLRTHYAEIDVVDWYKQCKHILETKKYIHDCIKGMSRVYRWRVSYLSNSDMLHFIDKCQENNGVAYQYVLHFLSEIINQEVVCFDTAPSDGLVTLTTQHYAKVVYDFVKQHGILKPKWVAMITDANRYYTPDAVCKFVFSWLYPRSEIGGRLLDQHINSLVTHVLRQLPSHHPLMRFSEQTKAQWKNGLLLDNMYDPDECRIIFNILSNSLFRRDILEMHSVHGLRRFQMDELVQDEFCHRNIMFIIYETAARWCGVKVILKGSRNHLFVYWRDNWRANGTKYLVDPQTGIIRLSTGRCPFNTRPSPFIPEIPDVYDPVETMLNVIPQIDDSVTDFSRRVLVNSIELAWAVAPNVPLYIGALTNMYILQRNVLDPLIRHLEVVMSLDHSPRDREYLKSAYDRAVHAHHSRACMDLELRINVKHRRPDVMYGIGLICKHLSYNYNCVITGWDYECRASTEWQHNMGVNNLPQAGRQPFYHVVAEDASLRYVAQENLAFIKSPCRLKEVEDVFSVDFSHFNGYVYIPNHEKLQEYPDDPAHVMFYVNKMYK